MTQPDLVQLDREGVEVWPCLREDSLGEWRLRFGGGAYGRSNSVQPFGDPGLHLMNAIEHCRLRYEAEGLRTTFRIPELDFTTELETALEALGYQAEDQAFVQVANRCEGLPDNGVELTKDPSEEWLATYLEGSQRGDHLRSPIREIQLRIPRPRCYAGVWSDGRLVSVGAAAIRLGTLWIFNIATDAAERGRGHASRVSGALLDWGARQGAGRAALQVTRANAPALALYGKFGFRTVYGYHYRRL